MQTPAASLRGARRLCQGQRPGRSRYSSVPDTVAIRSSAGSPPQGSVPLGRAHGRGGRRAITPAAPRRRSGGTLGHASALIPFSGTASAEPVKLPRPTLAALVVLPSIVPRRTAPSPELRCGAAGNNAAPPQPEGSERRARPASHQSVGLPGFKTRTSTADSRSMFMAVIARAYPIGSR